MKVPGTKVIIGDGESMESLKIKYPDAVFLGRKPYTEVPKYMASANKFVFSSLTDTFGLVQIEALACGIPVIGYRVQGPKDVITSDTVGRLAEYDAATPDQNIRNLEAAWHATDGITSETTRTFAEAHSWERAALEFLHFLHRLPKPESTP